MSFVNSYKPAPFHIYTAPDPSPFDIKFNALVPDKLETPRVRLVPFTPSIHSKPFYTEYRKNRDETEKYLPLSWPDYPTFLTWIHNFILEDASSLLFVIIDRTKGEDGDNLEESIAGLIGYIHSSTLNLSIEIGPVLVLPRAQRTFVSSNAIGLMLKYALDLPKNGGLGLRRVAWTANPNNQASVRAAQRMGFTIEGVVRWTWVLPVGKDGGKPPVDGKRGEGQGRDSTLLSLCWDDWEGGVREKIEQAMQRV
ncbi:acyl-CoA N-acyltransferase [Coprinellus micaceus]|uniref:Acyl-CoA N-acyltransferase n=1 Tax=Coprinellus micaceus TaxID=71717 RepID=A0A4Y7TGN0_COPMI|nr:acyl-CoA N-acyltransferase [Coprinellus micaceus]